MVRLSRTAHYAIRTMAYIARNGNDQPVIGGEAARALKLPKGFLLRILVGLSKAGLLQSLKGPNGGYLLARPAAQITVLEIVEAADGRRQAFSDGIVDALDAKLATAFQAADDAAREQLAMVRLVDLAGATERRRKAGK